MKKQFTLSELLLIVGVGSIVFAAALSAVQANAAAAKNMTCQDRLRKIGQAALLYAEKNANFVPFEPRKDSKEMVESFGNNQSRKSWGDYLIWGEYFGDPRPAGRFEKDFPQERMKYFVCPEDKIAYQRTKFSSSYFFFSINDVAAVKRNRFGGEQYSRVLVGRDRPENSVVFDVFPYRGGLFKQSAHGENANVLRLGGDVESFNIKPAASASNIWNWIGEYMDGIEL